MLEAIYYARVKNVENLNRGGDGTAVTPAIDDSAIAAGFEYKIIAYSKRYEYVLVVWSFGDGVENITGETLWKNQIPIAHGGGELNLYHDATPNAKRRSLYQDLNDIWLEYAQSDNYISDNLGRFLRENLIYL